LHYSNNKKHNRRWVGSDGREEKGVRSYQAGAEPFLPNRRFLLHIYRSMIVILSIISRALALAAHLVVPPHDGRDERGGQEEGGGAALVDVHAGAPEEVADHLRGSEGKYTRL
jgi:hypothetical protein